MKGVGGSWAKVWVGVEGVLGFSFFPGMLEVV